MDYENQKIINVGIQKEMKKSYIDYAMSVIVGRALPDVRDGLKPVHRRILYTMYEAGTTPDKPHKKCAATVGDVLGKYHPHGDAAVYDSMVRMAQDFSLRYPLIDGHGNFGSVDGDNAAAYRYTEARMAKLATEMLTDIEKETVDFAPNFDESLKEPTVLPARFPNLLLNGSSGIAVGMATNIPPHNLTEVSNGIIALIDNPDIGIDELMVHIKGPDFPTHGIIMGTKGIRDAYETGRGRIIVRSRAEIEEYGNNREAIIVTEIPYQVNKAKLIENIAELVKDKRIEGISDLRDESDRDGMRIVIELKKDANGNVILNQLYKYTQMQDSFCVNMLALQNNQPKVMNLKQILEAYVLHQEDVIIRRTRHDLAKAEARAHILEGLKTAIDHIDEVIEIIKKSASIPESKLNLIERFAFTDLQAQAIIEMRLGRLSGLERGKIENELSEIALTIIYLKSILSDTSLLRTIIKDELIAIRDKYGDTRWTDITAVVDDIDIEDLIPIEENVITLTHFGYIKRQPVDTYRSQRRGGRGITALSTREEDFTKELFVAFSHDHILFFTNMGHLHRIKAYHIPVAGRQAKGTAIVNLLSLEAGEYITAIVPVKKFEDDKFLIMLTKYGVMKKTELQKYNSVKKSGLNAITLDEGDELLRVKMTDGNCEVVIGTYNGMSIRFHEQDVRDMGRQARGVRAIHLRPGDYVVGMALVKEGAQLLSVTQKGLGKKTPFEEYRLQSRGGTGVKNYNITEKTGSVVGIKSVTDEDDVILITTGGVIIRINTNEIRSCGRATQGVKLMRTNEENIIASIARIQREDEEAEASIEEMQNTSSAPADEGEERLILSDGSEAGENMLAPDSSEGDEK